MAYGETLRVRKFNVGIKLGAYQNITIDNKIKPKGSPVSDHILCRSLSPSFDT